MLLKYFYDTGLAHASYMIGCQRSGEAIIIDPSRSVDQYLEAAKAEGLKIVGAAETHIHADFVSGARELAHRVGAKLYLSDEGTADWKYQNLEGLSAQLVKHRDKFYVGRVKLEVLHTPGHTPESISFLLTDEGGGASQPIGIFTGDFVFVGSIGRPDLLETAAGMMGTAEVGARQLYHSMLAFLELPDHLQVWPAHGAGSACGKGLGAIPSSTVGYEKLTNPALQFRDEQKFVDYILADQPETPFYFAVMKRVNKVGPAPLSSLPPVAPIDPSQLATLATRELVVDTAAAKEFGEHHVAGTINIPTAMLQQWAGFLVNYEKPVYFITTAEALPAQLRALRSIGIDNVAGYFESSQTTDYRQASYSTIPPAELQAAIESGKLRLIDVRAKTEFDDYRIAGAEHHFLGRLFREVTTIARDKPLVTQCLGGGRSAIAASILEREGFSVINMQGGIRAWQQAGLPTVQS